MHAVNTTMTPETDVDAIGRVVELIRDMRDRLANDCGPEQCAEITADFFRQFDRLCSELHERHNLTGEDADIFISSALARASKLLRSTV